MLKNILLAAASTILALLVAESALHFLAPTGLIPGRMVGTFADNDIPRSNAEPGLPRMMAGNATGTSQYYCYRTPLRTNEIGFHDIQWPESLRGGILSSGIRLYAPNKFRFPPLPPPSCVANCRYRS